MLFHIRKLIFIVLFNSSLFLILIIGIQNSSNKRKVNLIFKDTVSLPVSFVIGASFIAGSLTGSLLQINLDQSKK